RAQPAAVPAYWGHPTDPALSTAIGTDRQRGRDVCDLAGKVLQSLPDGRMNNVDVRYGFPLGGRSVDIVAASERTEHRIAVYGVDPATRRLSRSEEHTSELQSRENLVCRLLLEKKKTIDNDIASTPTMISQC